MINKNHFFSKIFNEKKIKKGKNHRKKREKIYNLLVLPIEKNSLRPELSSPPRFRIQGGGYPERDICTYVHCKGFSGEHKLFVKPEIRLNPSSVNTTFF